MQRFTRAERPSLTDVDYTILRVDSVRDTVAPLAPSSASPPSPFELLPRSPLLPVSVLFLLLSVVSVTPVNLLLDTLEGSRDREGDRFFQHYLNRG